MGAKTDTNKAKEEIVAFCPREGGAGRFRTETGQEEFTAPELLSKLHTLQYICMEDGGENRGREPQISNALQKKHQRGLGDLFRFIFRGKVLIEISNLGDFLCTRSRQR